MQQLCPDPPPAVFRQQRDRQRGDAVTQVTVILHDPAPDRADDPAAQIGDKAVIAGLCTEIRKIDLQLRRSTTERGGGSTPCGR